MKGKKYIANGRLTSLWMRLADARNRRDVVQVMAFEQMAARRAGGVARPIDAEALRDGSQKTLPDTDLGELDAIKLLPGMVGATADTLHKVWRTGINLSARAGDHPRLAAMAALEQALLERLPSSMLRPVDLASQALARLHLAPVLFGEIRSEEHTSELQSLMRIS